VIAEMDDTLVDEIKVIEKATANPEPFFKLEIDMNSYSLFR